MLLIDTNSSPNAFSIRPQGSQASNFDMITGTYDTHSFIIRLIFTPHNVHQAAGFRSQSLRAQMNLAWAHRREVVGAALPIELTF